jgi:nitrogenase molybdenum-iron protein alpha/beta subunit
MPRDCLSPLWPCAMTGAAACLSGFSDLGVIVHGSSGCFYYTKSLVQAPVHCTFLVEDEIIFGTGDRLREVVAELSGRYAKFAVVTSCVPAVMGEDIRAALSDYDVLVVDAPGFLGNFEEGYRHALDLVAPRISPDRDGVNIDGISASDRFSPGNRMEAARLLALAGIPVAATFAGGSLAEVSCAAPITVETNPDLQSGVGVSAGSLLGIPNLRDTFGFLGDRFTTADVSPVLREIDEAEERIIRACDRYLRRFDPPSVMIFASASYAGFSASMLKTYLDATIALVAPRNTGGEALPYMTEQTTDLGRIRELITLHRPDLVIGSSYEQAGAPASAFVGITYPVQGRIMLHHRPLAGAEGALYFTEEVLNACMDRRRRR